MAQVDVYIMNKIEYDKGNRYGSWFALPVTYEEVAEKIGLDESDIILEEYFIYDHNAPYGIPEDSTISQMNRDYAFLEKVMEKITVETDVRILINQCFGSIEKLYNALDSICVYNVTTLAELAYLIADERGILDTMGEWSRYFSCARYGLDLCNQETFVQGRAGFYKIN